MKNLRGFPNISDLPRRQAHRRVSVYIGNSVLVGNFKELIDLSLQEIDQPLNQLGPESPYCSPLWSLFQSPFQSPPQSPRRIMAEDVPPNPNENQPNPPPSWRDKTPFNLALALHTLPQNADKSLPKFDSG